jgi:hypothetical protein
LIAAARFEANVVELVLGANVPAEVLEHEFVVGAAKVVDPKVIADPAPSVSVTAVEILFVRVKTLPFKVAVTLGSLPLQVFTHEVPAIAFNRFVACTLVVPFRSTQRAPEIVQEVPLVTNS